MPASKPPRQDRIEKQIQLHAPVSRVWKALTDYRQFGEWFQVKMATPFVPGKPCRGHITYPGYEHLTMEIVVEQIEPEHYFSYTWHPFAVDPRIDYTQEEPTLVEFFLEATKKGTLLRVVESGFSKIPEERFAAAVRANSRGWQQQMDNITAYVAQHA